MPLVFEHILKICSDKHDLKNFPLQNKIIGDFSGICPNCFKADQRLDADHTFSSDGFCWRCPKKNCRKKISTNNPNPDPDPDPDPDSYPIPNPNPNP